MVAAFVAHDVTPAGAKDGVVARVRTPISRDADPGTKVTVVFTLTFAEAGTRRPFGGGAVFIRLIGPDGSRSGRVYAEQRQVGRYRATARVPRGGVRRIEIGLMGMLCDATGRPGCHPAPKHFPLVGRVFR